MVNRLCGQAVVPTGVCGDIHGWSFHGVRQHKASVFLSSLFKAAASPPCPSHKLWSDALSDDCTVMKQYGSAEPGSARTSHAHAQGFLEQTLPWRERRVRRLWFPSFSAPPQKPWKKEETLFHVLVLGLLHLWFVVLLIYARRQSVWQFNSSYSSTFWVLLCVNDLPIKSLACV